MSADQVFKEDKISHVNSHLFHIFTTFVTAILSEQTNVNFSNFFSDSKMNIVRDKDSNKLV